jgi:hypothetical protein
VFWRWKDGGLDHTIPGGSARLLFAGKGRELVQVRDSRLLVSEAEDGQIVFSHKAEGHGSGAISPDGTFLAIGDGDVVRVYTMESSTSGPNR